MKASWKLLLVLAFALAGVPACEDEPPEEEAVEEIEEGLEQAEDETEDILDEAEDAQEGEDITPPAPPDTTG